MKSFSKEIWFGIGAIALGLSLPAFAQTPPDRDQLRLQMMERLDTDHDGKISDAEWQAATDKRFASADANGDGFVTEAELKAAHDARKAEMREKREHAMFARLDTNGDGKLSKEEFEAGSRKFRERMQQHAQGDDGGPRGPGFGGPPPQGGMGFTDAPPPDSE